ncbi:MAG: phage antirepressor N-terminal domain-containing protein [Acinetobacter sp.]
MNTKSKIVKFNNQQVPVFMQGDKPYVLMKPICENIGLDWNSQKKRINRNAVLSKGKVMMTSPSNGGDQEYIALPLGMLNGWLMGVDANKVRPEIKDTLVKYQLECYDVLYKHFVPKPPKQIDMSMYVSKDVHNKLSLKYHRMFREYDDMIDTMRTQVEAMQRKCRRYDFKMARSAISIEEAASVLKVPVAKIKKVFQDEFIIEERCAYVESSRPILKLTERGKSFDVIFIQNEIVANGVEEVIMINEDGMAYLRGRV